MVGARVPVGVRVVITASKLKTIVKSIAIAVLSGGRVAGRCAHSGVDAHPILGDCHLMTHNLEGLHRDLMTR
jgi:hypothetical protein